MKKCNKCKVEKPLKEFYIDRVNTDGRNGICAKCEREKELKRREEKKFLRQFNII